VWANARDSELGITVVGAALATEPGINGSPAPD
jgi:hypothetical protein